MESLHNLPPCSSGKFLFTLQDYQCQYHLCCASTPSNGQDSYMVPYCCPENSVGALVICVLSPIRQWMK